MGRASKRASRADERMASGRKKVEPRAYERVMSR